MIRRWVWVQWHRRSWMWLLWPLSCLYAVLMKLRQQCYLKGWLRSVRVPAPVWVIGNLTVGGTGKTALVMHLAHMLVQKGLRPGIISRGYGGEVSSTPRLVTASDSVAVVGDEALLMVTKTACPMVVCSDRVRAAQALLQHHGCDVLLSDDGLQHLALQRDLEVVVQDDQRGFGNGWCLPAGPLREPAGRQQTVDLVVLNGPQKTFSIWMNRICRQVSRLGQPDVCCLLEDFCGVEIQLMSAIGDPERLRFGLSSQGLVIKYALFFKDHHLYHSSDLNGLRDGIPVFVTEKDAIKMIKIKTNHVIWVLKESIELSVALNRQFAEYFATLLGRP